MRNLADASGSSELALEHSQLRKVIRVENVAEYVPLLRFGGSGFRVQDSGFRAQGSGFGVKG